MAERGIFLGKGSGEIMTEILLILVVASWLILECVRAGRRSPPVRRVPPYDFREPDTDALWRELSAVIEDAAGWRAMRPWDRNVETEIFLRRLAASHARKLAAALEGEAPMPSTKLT